MEILLMVLLEKELIQGSFSPKTYFPLILIWVGYNLETSNLALKYTHILVLFIRVKIHQYTSFNGTSMKLFVIVA